MPDEWDVHVTGVEDAMKAVVDLADDADEAMRELTEEVAEQLAEEARAAARSDRAPQTSLMVPTVSVYNLGEPSVMVGGSTPVGRRRTAAHNLVFGSEFGSNVHTQFQRPRNSDGYWFRPAISNSSAIDRELEEAGDDVARTFERGG